MTYPPSGVPFLRIVSAITGIAGAAIVSLPLCVMFIIAPSFTKLAEENANQESFLVASHLAASLVAKNSTIARGRLSKEFIAEADESCEDIWHIREQLC